MDIVPRRGPCDNILLSEDHNPNTNGARLILASIPNPGEKLPAVVEAIRSGQIKALVALGENPASFGISDAQLAGLPAFIVMDILSNDSTEKATAVLPSFGFAEKRGSMINGDGRLQRLNRAVRGPGNARDDWEILRDLLQALTGSDSESDSRAGGIYSLEDVFRQLSEAIPEFAGLSLSKIGDRGVQVIRAHESPPPPTDPEMHDIEKAEAKKPPGR
jgi:NADH-quinone oxidoreductase subunit G